MQRRRKKFLKKNTIQRIDYKPSAVHKERCGRLDGRKTMKQNYSKTIKACFWGYIVQAIVNNFAPMLFVRFGTEYGIALSKITMLITVNFLLQLLIDFASAFFIDKIGYKASAVIAHFFAFSGLAALAFLPDMFDNPFTGIVISVLLYAVGGGLLEVVVSPIVEACPSEHKDKTMSLLHSFYCWGTVGVVLFSTLYFAVAGIENWKILSAIFAAVPLINGISFLFLSVPELSEGEDNEMKLAGLFKTKLFWVFMLIIMCSGACEQAVSQWASVFTEKALGISKSVSDLAGPLIFSVFMGLSRTVYGKYGDRINMNRMFSLSGGLCALSYLLISLSPSALLALFGMALAGFSVGILWPGTYSMASEQIKGGGTRMFAFLALAGDFGCSAGPAFAGKAASIFNDNLKIGILAALIFPIVLLATHLINLHTKK